MQKIIGIITLFAIVFSSYALFAESRKRWASARYQPVAGFLESDATLSHWFKQYVNTTSGNPEFKDFLKRLVNSDILWQRNRRAGLTHNQLYSPLLTLTEKNWRRIDRMTPDEKRETKLAMLELDIVLAIIDATLPDSAHEEFRREVLRGAKPLREVAKLPKNAVEVMTFTLMGHKVSNRINKGTAESNVENLRFSNPEQRDSFPIQ